MTAAEAALQKVVPGTKMDADLTKADERFMLGLERYLPHPPEKVWRVLTERELLRQWFPCDVEGEWKVGAQLRFTFMHGEGEGLPEEQLRGEVLTAPRLLEFRWGSVVEGLREQKPAAVSLRDQLASDEAAHDIASLLSPNYRL